MPTITENNHPWGQGWLLPWAWVRSHVPEFASQMNVLPCNTHECCPPYLNSMPICLPQQCLALVNGLPPPGDPLFRESPGWWVRLQSVGHKHRTCSHVFVPENLEDFRKLFYAYTSTPAMPGPCEWAPTPWRSLVQGVSRVVGQAAECRPQTQNVFPCFCARKLGRF